MSIATASNIPPASMMPVVSKQPFMQSSSSNPKEISSNKQAQSFMKRDNKMTTNKQPDASINNIVGVVIMVKNEETSIQVTIDSVKDYIKHIIVFDTGSTDKTLDIVKKTCKKFCQ